MEASLGMGTAPRWCQSGLVVGKVPCQPPLRPHGMVIGRQKSLFVPASTGCCWVCLLGENLWQASDFWGGQNLLLCPPPRSITHGEGSPERQLDFSCEFSTMCLTPFYPPANMIRYMAGIHWEGGCKRKGCTSKPTLRSRELSMLPWKIVASLHSPP